MSEHLHVLTDEDAQRYLDLGITGEEEVRLRWPDATRAEAGFILWELTPFPMVSGLHDIVDAVAEVPEPYRSKAASAGYRVACPTCGASPFAACRTRTTGRVTDTHAARTVAKGPKLSGGWCA